MLVLTSRLLLNKNRNIMTANYLNNNNHKSKVYMKISVLEENDQNIIKAHIGL